MVVLNEITKTAVVSNGVRERNTASNSELKKKTRKYFVILKPDQFFFLQNKRK